MNPDYTILCQKCHQRVVRAETMQGQIIILEPIERAYIYNHQGVKLRAQRISQAGIKHQCPAEKGK